MKLKQKEFVSYALATIIVLSVFFFAYDGWLLLHEERVVWGDDSNIFVLECTGFGGWKIEKAVFLHSSASPEGKDGCPIIWLEGKNTQVVR
ncbi:MAG: hypothetical protein ABH880_01535 [Patescibacteria group bacterium]